LAIGMFAGIRLKWAHKNPVCEQIPWEILTINMYIYVNVNLFSAFRLNDL